jgi:ATP-dependent helicase HrpB
MLDGARDLGLRFTDAAERLRARVAAARAVAPDLPDLGDAALMDTLDAWLLPFLGDVRTAEAFRRLDLGGPLRAILSHDDLRRLDALAPPDFATPLGRRVPIDYGAGHGGEPAASVRLQEVLGLDAHPVAGGRPLRLTLLSPGAKPVAVTSDLPGFWRGAYADVRREMRGRYPRHPWPEEPWRAEPTTRAKPRGT